jgi:hypothetical protein
VSKLTGALFWQGGPLDICTLCQVLDCELNPSLDSNWLENMPRFTAVRFNGNGKNAVLATMPGEPLSQLGFEVRSDLKALGFDTALLAGYSNNHMGYFVRVARCDGAPAFVG